MIIIVKAECLLLHCAPVVFLFFIQDNSSYDISVMPCKCISIVEINLPTAVIIIIIIVDIIIKQVTAPTVFPESI